MDKDRIEQLFGLDEKTALVTGGSRGIGMMVAGALLDAGARVYVSSRKGEADGLQHRLWMNSRCRQPKLARHRRDPRWDRQSI